MSRKKNVEFFFDEFIQQIAGVSVSESNGDVQIASLKVKISDYESKMSHMKYIIEEKDNEIKNLKDVGLFFVFLLNYF